MGRPTLKVKGYKPEQIKAIIDDNKDYKTGMRLFAVYQMALGKSSIQVGEIFHTSFKQITNWVHQFEAQGVAGLVDKPGRGRESRLSAAQKEKIAEVLEDKRPTDYGYNTATWTGPLLIDWMKGQFGITYKKAQIYNIIKSLGFSFQKGKGAYQQADPEKQEEFKTTLKKNA
jgi:transposase